MVNMEWIPVTKKLSELEPWTRNPRQINEVQAKRLKESFEEFGQVETIAIGPDNEIYNGHQRLNVLMQENGGDYEIECRQSDKALSEKEREKLTVFLHKGAAGEWDWDILANEFEMDDLIDWGFEEWELIGFDKDPPGDPGPRIDEAEGLVKKWEVKEGQLWQLGRHKVICGDCTDQEVVDQLINGETISAVFMDPPYGINYSDVKGKFDKMRGDNISPETLIADSLNSITCDSLYICCNWQSIIFIYGALAILERKPKAVIVWDKENRVQNLDKYGKRHEFIVYSGKFGGEKTVDDDVWSIKRNTRSDHPAVKPAELITRAIQNEGKEIFDPFLGSGSTLVACEQINRTCYGIEIEPKFVAVTLERWHEMTGEKPVLLSNLHT